MNRIIVPLFLASTLCLSAAENSNAPVHFAIFGLEHDHAAGFIPRAKDRKDIQLVGIIEPREDLVSRYAAGYQLDRQMFYPRLEAVLENTNTPAGVIFNSTLDHRRVVEMCAPKCIHVMMEKPLAVNMEHGRAIEAAAKQGNIQIIVNYETTWYPGNQAAYGLVHEQKALGDLRKIVVHD